VVSLKGLYFYFCRFIYLITGLRYPVTGARDPVCAAVKPQPPRTRDRPQGSANPSDFEREYYSYFCLPPARLFKFVQTQFDEPDVADMIVQRNPKLIFDEFRKDLRVYDSDNWSDLYDSEDEDFDLRYD